MFKFLQTGLGSRLFYLSLWGIGFTSLSAVVWMAGPFVSIGGWHPLENYVVREMAVVLIAAMLAGAGSVSFFRRRKGAAAIADAIAGGGAVEDKKPDDDAIVLKDKMKDALQTLKTGSGGKAEFLYDLPWYLLIGPPGSGKTTALVNSGLKFPLARGATPAAIAGVGGTRYCDWWFTDDAVLIDTAGRYTTQDSDAKSDQASWFSFLDLLKKNRPRQPINGVIVAISLEDIMVLGTAELNAHANAIRTRLVELHERLKVDFPVYVLFTKADLVAGFMEFFGNLGENGRKQVWGATFQTGDKTRNLVGEVPHEFDALIERLNVDLTDRLQEEPAPATRVSLFGLPAQMSALKRPIYDFLNSIFEPTRYHANATLRGFYFTSGTQEGTPIDQVIGALARSFGAEEVQGVAYSGKGKSFFLTDLINKVIIGEAAWVSTDRSAVRRAMIVKAVAFSVIALATITLASLWWISYSRNRALIDATEKAATEYAAVAGPLAKENIISDRDLAKVLPLLYRLRHLPAGFANRNDWTPVMATFGLSQRERLQSASENAYRVGLERMYRSRLIYRLEEQLEAAMKPERKDTGFIYEALKVYLMLGGVQNVPLDRNLIVSWMRRDWTDNLYPGAANGEGRKALEEHLVAMFDLEQGEPFITLHGPLVEEAQKTLGRLSVSQRAYELLKSQARTANVPDWVAARQGGPDIALVFEAAGNQPLDSIRVPGFYTYAGFHRAFMERLGNIAETVKKERWVLGSVGEQAAVAEQYERLPEDLLTLYTRDFIATWRDALAMLRLKRLTADKPKYVALSAIAAATSPLKQIMESVRDETALTRERAGFKKAEAKPEDQGGPGSAVLMQQGDRAPGALIEATFKHLHVFVDGDGSRKQTDAVVANLAEINQSLTTIATAPSQTAQATAQLQVQISNLKAAAARMPPPFADMMRGAATDFERDVARSSASLILDTLRAEVTPQCRRIVEGRYPFVRTGTSEVSLQEFGRLFGTGGILDGYFKQTLAPLVDTSKRDWTFRPDKAESAVLNPAMLRDFQRAEIIRDTFFTGGGNQPAVTLAIVPPRVDPGITAKMEINGAVIESKPGGSLSPVSVQWPGAVSIARAAVTVTPDAPPPEPALPPAGGRQAFAEPTITAAQPGPPSVLERGGVWSLFRLVEAASPRRRGDRIVASFIVGGRDLQYQISAGVQNPLDLGVLREFRCPTGT
jgi:type VI secretion system protein ImpL